MPSAVHRPKPFHEPNMTPSGCAAPQMMAAPMAAFGVLLVALPLIYVLCTSLVTGGKFQFGMAVSRQE